MDEMLRDKMLKVTLYFRRIKGKLYLTFDCPNAEGIEHGLPAKEVLELIKQQFKGKKKPFYVRETIKRVIRWKKKFRFYLAGPISWVSVEEAVTWRVDMTKYLESIGHEAVNPLAKYPVPAGEKKKVEKSIMWEKDEEAREYLRRRIMNPDIELLKQSDGIIASIPRYSVGTSAELMYAYLHNMPVYIVTDMPRKKWSGWFMGLSTLIFTNWDDLKRFLKYMKEGV